MMQSPYIIPTRAMRRVMSFEYDATTYALTNSMYASPNLFAMAGYQKHRGWVKGHIDHLYEYQGPGSIHAKTYVIDGRISAIGSFNLEARSSFLSTESMVVIDSEAFTHALMGRLEALSQDSVAVNTSGAHWPNPRDDAFSVPWQKRVMIRVLWVIFYPFDGLL